MRRRKRSNPLLAKTVLVGVGVTILVLPILAKLGLFKQLHDQYIQTELINLPPPPPQPKEAKPKARKTVHPHVEGHHGARITRATVQVHVQATNSSKASSAQGPEIVNKAPGGPLGQLPSSPPPPAPPPPAKAPSAPAPPVVQLPPVVPTPPPAPQPDVVVEATPVSQPLPVIPDDLLDSDIDTTFYGYFTIHIDGTVDVKMVQGTGNSILDRLAMDAAKQWKFTPATRNGAPVESYRRLEVEFVVNDND